MIQRGNISKTLPRENRFEDAHAPDDSRVLPRVSGGCHVVVVFSPSSSVDRSSGIMQSVPAEDRDDRVFRDLAVLARYGLMKVRCMQIRARWW